jgi:hypothetical protein
MVIRPAVLPNSSITIARWLRLVRKSRSSSFSRLLSGTKTRRPQQRAQVQLGRALQLEQVLGHQDADDVVALALVDRKARVAGVDHHRQQFVVGRVDVQQVHARRGHHHVAGRHVGHAQHAFEHEARFGLDQLALLGVGQGSGLIKIEL